MKKLPVCEEHLELAFDVIVDEFEVPPTLQKMENDEEKQCEFCGKLAMYIVSN